MAKTRTSSLGCLTRLLLFLALAVLATAVTTGIVAPWAFFLGGRFHLLPVWQGVGRIHAASGDYVLYFWVSPSGGGRRFNLPTFRGWGALCTPRGQEFPLRVSASFSERVGIATVGKEFRLSVYRRPWYYEFSNSRDDRPRLDFRGRWQGERLTMSDNGSVSRMFLPDATLFQGRPAAQPAARETLQVRFREVGWLGWWSGCHVLVDP